MVERTTAPSPGSYRWRLALTQAAFFVLLAWCIAIDHTATAESDGISFYGVNHRTVVILAVGFVIAFWGLWGAGRYLASADVPPGLALGVRVVALFLFVILATPYTVDTLFNWTHMTAGVIMALTQLAIAFALLARDRGFTAAIAFTIQLAGGIVAALSLPDWSFAYMLQGEVTFQVGFALVMLQWLSVAAPLGEVRTQSSERTIE